MCTHALVPWRYRTSDIGTTTLSTLRVLTLSPLSNHHHTSTQSAQVTRMMTSDLLISLPTAICCGVLGDWVDFKSLVVLDSAYCSSSHRKAFLTLLQTDELRVHEPLTSTNLHWFNIKSVNVSSIISGGSTNSDVLGSYLSRFGGSVRSVEFDPGSAPAIISLVALHCHSLVSVHLENGDFIAPEFRELLEGNPLLEELRFVSLRTYDQGNVQDRNTASFLGIHLPKLHTLSLNHSWCSGEQMLEALQLNKNILRLHVGLGSFGRSPGSFLSRIAEFCPHLRALSLPDWSDYIMDDEVATITSGCRHIVHLDLGNTEIEDSAFLFITNNLQGLRSLNIKRCSQLTSASLELICTHYSRTLETLHLTKSSDSGPQLGHADVSKLLQQCTNLHTLSWLEETEYQEPALVLTSAVSRLTNLALGWDAVSDANLHAVGQNCAHLRTLSLYLPHGSHSLEGRAYTLAGFTALLQGCVCLQEVYIDVPMHFQATPHASAVPIMDLIRSLRPDIKVYWKPTDEQKFAYNALKMPL